MPLSAGASLGIYEILSPLGAGGMGEVYRARDTKLGREVAVKTLADEFSQDEERVARFQREAKLLASLNHTNIATLYGLEEWKGRRFLVMELVEGETLAERIARGPLPLDEVLPLFAEIALGLETAHERGVLHRDLKPANIKIAPGGAPKILDFGLAKALVGDEDRAEASSQSPTLTKGTALGAIMGTAAYMSPEQARGKPVDKRTDLWALGCCLYEALSGRRAFAGEAVADVIGAIVHKEPDWSALPEVTPAPIRRLLRRCLQKDRRKRLAEAADARLEIEDALAGVSDRASARLGELPASRGWRPFPLAAGAFLIGSLLAGLVIWTVRREPAPRTARVSVTTGAGYVLRSYQGSVDIALSPDGGYLAYPVRPREGGSNGLILRPVDRFESTPLADVGYPQRPFFSPDGEWVGFVQTADGTMMKASLRGGPATRICDLPGATLVTGASWGPDGTILFTTYPGYLWRVPSAGGEPQELIPLAPGERYAWPEILPGGDAVLLTVLPSQSLAGRNAQIRALSLQTLEQKPLVHRGTHARYVPTGHLVYGDGSGGLLAAAFDLERLEVAGEPVPVLDGIFTDSSIGAVDFAVSRNGTLAYVPDDLSLSLRRRPPALLTWVGRDGHGEELAAEARYYSNPRISPDGRRVALDVRDQYGDIWLWDFALETLTRLTFDPFVDGYPVWAPDGAHIVFESHRDGPGNIYLTASDGTGQVSRLTESRNHQSPLSISPDGRWVIFEELSPQLFLGILSLEEGGSERVLLQADYAVTNGEVSPDGRWLAYQSEASGRNEIYVQPFPNVDEGRWQISNGGGTEPVWAPDGRELYYVSAERRLMAVRVDPDPAFSAGKPTAVLGADYRVADLTEGTRGRSYDVARDGSRFLLLKPTEASEEREAPTELRLILNWHEELKRLVPLD